MQKNKKVFKIDPLTFSEKWLKWRTDNCVIGIYNDIALSLSDRNCKAFLNETFPGIESITFDNENCLIVATCKTVDKSTHKNMVRNVCISIALWAFTVIVFAFALSKFDWLW